MIITESVPKGQSAVKIKEAEKMAWHWVSTSTHVAATQLQHPKRSLIQF